jgi:drug/metabolite transporter (DMT)-like permease
MIGVFVFGESFTVRIALGALLIVFAVILVVSQNVVAGLKKGWHKLR